MAVEAPEQVVERRLERLRRRMRWVGLGAGLGRVMLVVVGVVLGVVGLDYVLNLPAWPRVVVGVGAAAVLVWAVWRWVVRTAMWRASLSDVAGRVEEAFPELEDRVRSAVEFARVEGIGGGGGGESEVLRARVRAEAAERVARLDLRRAADAGPAKRWLARGGACAAVLLVLGAVMPGAYRSAVWERLTDPFGGHAWPKRTQIAVMGELPERVAAGDRVGVRVRLVRGDRPGVRATVFYQYDNGVVRQELMSRGADGVYTASLDARSGEEAAGLRIWVKAGDDEKVLGGVTVVPRLAVRRVTLEVIPPPYARGAGGEVGGGASGSFDLMRAAATVVEGSEVRLVAEYNKPLGEEFGVSGLAGSAATTAVRQNVGEARWVAEKTSRVGLSAVDEDGFPTVGASEYEVVVRPDQQPAIQIELPRRSEERTATAVVPLEGVGEDDFALVEVELRVRRLGDGREWVLPLVSGGRNLEGVEWGEVASGPGRVRMRVRYLWELSALTAVAGGGGELKSGDVLEYFLAARDNYRREMPGGEVLVHPEATSSRQRITIVSQQELASRLAEEMRAAAGQIEQARLAQRRTSEETTELAESSRGRLSLDDAQQRQARRLAEQQSAVASQSRQLAGRMEDVLRRMAENRLEGRELPMTARDVRDTLERASEGPMKDAAGNIAEARQTEQAARREGALTQAENQQAEAETLLGQAMERLGSLGTLSQTMENLQRLLEAQQEVGRETRELARENVGKRLDQMSAADREKLRELTERQRELGERTGQMLGQMDQQAEQLSQSDPQSSEALKQAAQSGRQQNVPGAQQRASSAMSQNQQNQAQSDQRQAEIGLQVMLDQLRESERRKLEALAKKLADLSEQLAVLVRRQAGHNLDNLGNTPGAMERLTAELRAELLGLAERTAERAVAGDVGALSAGQELTERNTRGLAAAASAVQGGAEVASVLSRAAGRMERAAVLIRGRDLPGAYEPPQVEALAGLRQAAEQVSAMQRRAEQELEQRQREAIKAVYEAVRADQDALNRETARIGEVSDRAGGQVPRAELVRLGQLPGQQGGLSERVAALEEDLARLGSVVFLWANKEIVGLMGDVRARLEKREVAGAPGAAARAEQARVLAQLDAMIASLTIKPYEKEFEERNASSGGGGEGQPQQRLPAEAELRLLKALQEMVNRGTSEAAARGGEAGGDGGGEAERLGGRQGELRGLLGEMMTKATQGRFKMPEELSKPLPEEASGAAEEDRDLDNDLLLGKPVDGSQGQTGGVGAVADRMGRSRVRLADNKDVGPVTQRLQSRILEDLDRLIEEARRQDQQQSQSSGSSGGQQKSGVQPGGEQANNQGQGGQQGERQPSQGGDGATTEADRAGGLTYRQGGDLRERLAEWGAISPRQRQAIIEGASDMPVEKYRLLIEAYYRALAEKQSGSGTGTGGRGGR